MKSLETTHRMSFLSAEIFTGSTCENTSFSAAVESSSFLALDSGELSMGENGPPKSSSPLQREGEVKWPLVMEKRPWRQVQTSFYNLCPWPVEHCISHACGSFRPPVHCSRLCESQHLCLLERDQMQGHLSACFYNPCAVCARVRVSLRDDR